MQVAVASSSGSNKHATIFKSLEEGDEGLEEEVASAAAIAAISAIYILRVLVLPIISLFKICVVYTIIARKKAIYQYE